MFFALWPDDSVRAEIVDRRPALEAPARPVPGHNLHLTLLFLGDQPAGRLDAIEQAADTVAGPAFDLVLDRLGWFPRARVLWLGGSAPRPLEDLAIRLAAALRDRHLVFDPRPLRPHVTLYRKIARRPALSSPRPLHWPVRDFALIESIPSRPYQVLRKWPVG